MKSEGRLGKTRTACPKAMQDFFEKLEKSEKRRNAREEHRRVSLEKAIIAIRAAGDLVVIMTAAENCEASGRMIKEELEILNEKVKELRAQRDGKKVSPESRRKPAEEIRFIEQKLLARFGDKDTVMAGFGEIITPDYELPKKERGNVLVGVSIHLEFCTWYYQLIAERNDFPLMTGIVDSTLMQLIGFANLAVGSAEQLLTHKQRTERSNEARDWKRMNEGWGPHIRKVSARIDEESKAGKRLSRSRVKEIEFRLVREFQDEKQFPKGEKDYPSEQVIETTLKLLQVKEDVTKT